MRFIHGAALAFRLRHACTRVLAQFSRSTLNNLNYKVIGAAIEVHRHLGPGLLESVYQRCMERELAGRSLAFKSQQPLKVDYKDLRIDCGFRIDPSYRRSPDRGAKVSPGVLSRPRSAAADIS